jgi:hypothetical protein
MMNKTYTLLEDDIGGELYRRIYLLVRKNRWTRPSIGATMGLAGGMLSIILGALLWAVIVSHLASGSFGSFLNALEIVLFALSLPLLVLGTYCLDLLEKIVESHGGQISAQSKVGRDTTCAFTLPSAEVSESK